LVDPTKRDRHSPEELSRAQKEVGIMRAKFGLAGLLAALAVAGLPAVSSAGWCGALTAGLRPPDAPDAAEVRMADKTSREAVFKLACHSCQRGYGGYYSGYGAYYPGYGSYYSGYGTYSSGYGSYYYPRYSYSAGYGSYYPPGCGGWSPCGCAPSCSCYPGW
jgi:hypothetical protein